MEDQVEQLFNGWRFYYRDYDLSDTFVQMYYPGLIIQEMGFTDASSRRGGFVANHRFLIASPAATDLSQFDQTDPERGLSVLPAGSYFKVLDVTERNDRRQTTLLHFPEAFIEIFSRPNLTAFEEGVAAKAKNEFEELVDTAPVDALTKQSWLNRLTSPLGISDDGEYFLSQK